MFDRSPLLNRYQDGCKFLNKITQRIAEIGESVQLQVIMDDRLSQSVIAKIGNYRRTSLSYLLEEIDRQLSEPFRLVVIGRFSYGKTTFLNALLGRQLLKSDWRPNTAISTVLRYGTPERFVVHYRAAVSVTVEDAADLAGELAKYISDTSIGKDSSAVMRGDVKSLSAEIECVEVWLDSLFLRDHQVELIDTPGLGSVLEGHQRVTYNTVPQAHCVLFMTQSDLNIGEEEVGFLTSVTPLLDRFVYALTKADSLESAQKIRDAEQYLHDVLRAKLGIQNPPIKSISSILALEGDIPRSGLNDLLIMVGDKLAEIAGLPRLQAMTQRLLTYHLWLKHELTQQLNDLYRQENVHLNEIQ